MDAAYVTSAGILLAFAVVSSAVLAGIWLGGRISEAGAARAINTYPAELRERVEKVERDMLAWASTMTDELASLETRRKRITAAQSNAERAQAVRERNAPLTDAETRAEIGRKMRAV